MSRIPKVGQPIADGRGEATQPWRAFLQSLEGQGVQKSEIEAIARKLGSQDGTIEGIPDERLSDLSVVGTRSIQVIRYGDTFRVGLRGDDGGAAPNSHYGTNLAGELGMWPLPSALAESSTTSNLPEGTNLYFSIERAQDAAASMLVDGLHTGISFTYDDANGRVNATVTGGGGGGGAGEILVADGVSPPVMLTNESETDFLYAG